jgi:hypothetical protein
MGKYVTYSLGDPNGIRPRFLADLDSFIAWGDVAVEDFPDDYPPGFLDKARDIAQRGSIAFTTENEAEAWLIDRVVDEYWNFCDLTARHRADNLQTSMYHVRRYATDLSQVVPAASGLANSYYRQLFAGRSLAQCEGHVYHSHDGVFQLSWLTAAEVQAFFAELAPCEPQLDRSDEVAAGCVLLILEVLKQAAHQGLGLTVVIA